jgi:hypothetical protein
MSDEVKYVTVEQLWAAVGGGTEHNIENLKTMLSNTLDAKGKPGKDGILIPPDFFFQHKTTRYCVRRADIEEFFRTHIRPERPMSLADENAELRKRLAELEATAEAKKSTPVKPEIPLSFDGDDLAAASRAMDPGGHAASLAEDLKDVSPEKPKGFDGDL